jgi:hypothetical protein
LTNRLSAGLTENGSVKDSVEFWENEERELITFSTIKFKSLDTFPILLNFILAISIQKQTQLKNEKKKKLKSILSSFLLTKVFAVVVKRLDM